MAKGKSGSKHDTYHGPYHASFRRLPTTRASLTGLKNWSFLNGHVVLRCFKTGAYLGGKLGVLRTHLNFVALHGFF